MKLNYKDEYGNDVLLEGTPEELLELQELNEKKEQKARNNNVENESNSEESTYFVIKNSAGYHLFTEGEVVERLDNSSIAYKNVKGLSQNIMKDDLEEASITQSERFEFIKELNNIGVEKGYFDSLEGVKVKINDEIETIVVDDGTRVPCFSKTEDNDLQRELLHRVDLIKQEEKDSENKSNINKLEPGTIYEVKDLQCRYSNDVLNGKVIFKGKDIDRDYKFVSLCSEDKNAYVYEDHIHNYTFKEVSKEQDEVSNTKNGIKVGSVVEIVIDDSGIPVGNYGIVTGFLGEDSLKVAGFSSGIFHKSWHHGIKNIKLIREQ